MRRALATAFGFCAGIAAAALAPGQASAQAQPAPSPPAAAAEGSTIYLMDQLATGPLPQEIIKQMEPLHTLDAVEALLKANKIAFAWREAEVSSTEIAPQIAPQIAALPPHEVFVAPQGQGWIISVVVNTRQAPQAAPPPPAAVQPSPPLRPGAPGQRRGRRPI